MFKVLRFIKSLPNRVKKQYKKSLFKKLTEYGKNLDVDHTSMCNADHSGNITLGDNCMIRGTLTSQDNGKISFGNDCCVFHKTVIGAVNSITIGNRAIISNHIHIYDNNNHPTSPEVRAQMCLGGFYGDAWRWKHSESSPIVIEDDVWIGEYSAIMKGVRIGKGSIVAAHSVVTKDVPPYSVVAGNPARVVKTLDHE